MHSASDITSADTCQRLIAAAKNLKLGNGGTINLCGWTVSYKLRGGKDQTNPFKIVRHHGDLLFCSPDGTELRSLISVERRFDHLRSAVRIAQHTAPENTTAHALSTVKVRAERAELHRARRSFGEPIKAWVGEKAASEKAAAKRGATKKSAELHRARRSFGEPIKAWVGEKVASEKAAAKRGATKKKAAAERMAMEEAATVKAVAEKVVVQEEADEWLV